VTDLFRGSFGNGVDVSVGKIGLPGVRAILESDIKQVRLAAEYLRIGIVKGERGGGGRCR
jgi:hypothetical protein